MRMPPCLSFIAVALALVVAQPTIAEAKAPQTTALVAFTRAHTELETLVHAKGKPNPKTLATKVDALLDYHSITVTALGGPARYAKLCKAENKKRCAEIESLLTEIVRHSYLKQLASHPQGKVEILGQHVRAKASQVDTRVRIKDNKGKSKTAQVDYIMHSVDGHWKITDIVTDKQSLAKTYESEITKLSAGDDLEKVLKSLQLKRARLTSQH
ncbi:MAG: ABC transporter substrate-binding protein [Myxococcota bacterium]